MKIFGITTEREMEKTKNPPKKDSIAAEEQETEVNMDSQSHYLTRRKFMLISSTAIASPLLISAAGSMVGAKTAEARATVTNVKKGKGNKIYFIGNGCVGCHACLTFCPAEAIHFGDTGNEINQDKCIHCGTCYEECPISVVTETEF